jgi:hypothetical protein
MNRRGFITGLAALIGGIALEQAIPLGRVWSFPSVIKPAGGTIIARYPTEYVITEVFPRYETIDLEMRRLFHHTYQIKFNDPDGAPDSLVVGGGPTLFEVGDHVTIA